MLKRFLYVFILLSSLSGWSQEEMSKDKQNAEAIRQEILDHGKTIREAFRTNDIERIKLLHHPNVVKALSYTNIVNGREQVMKGLQQTLSIYKLEFVKNEVENIFIQDNLAIEQTLFTIKGTPKNGGDSWTFKGRTMVTYIRYKESPTGWATIREIIQPFSE